jgi:hypothetical protein
MLPKNFEHNPSRRLLVLMTLLLAPHAEAWVSTNALSIKAPPVHSQTTSFQNEIHPKQSRLLSLQMATPTEVDEGYYSPAFTDRLGSSQEMEMTAATMKYGMGGGSGGQKITLTRWLSAKVQDYPEVCSLCCDISCAHLKTLYITHH